MNFTWFASSYDTDDVPYRLLTMVQMAGVLVLAAGVPAAFDDTDFRAVTLGYLIMRIGLVAQWLRAAIERPGESGDGVRYAPASRSSQVAWLLRLALAETGVLPPASLVPVFAGLVVLELAVPAVGGAHAVDQLAPAPHRRALRPVHDHPARRERAGRVDRRAGARSRRAASACLPDDRARRAGAALRAVVALLPRAGGRGLADFRDRSYLWGYGHYGIFAALAAVGAGLEVAVEQTGHHLEVSAVAVAYAIADPGRRCSWSCCGPCTRRSCRGRSSGRR